MLPRKRAVGAAAADDDSSSNCAEISPKKPRLDNLVSPLPSSSDRNHMAHSNGNPPEIDEDLHSRQLAVYGRETMRRLFASNVLVSGMQGLGVEIAKNLILAGVKSVTLHDEGTVELWDLSSNFYFSEDDVGKNRALACVHKLQELNNAVVISTLTTELSKEQLSGFQEKSVRFGVGRIPLSSGVSIGSSSFPES